MRRKDGLCYGCGAQPAGLGGYCRPCSSAKNKANYLRRKSVCAKLRPDACNCKDPTCNGLTCERVSA